MSKGLMSWSQFPTLSSLQDEVNRTFERFWRDGSLPEFGKGTLMAPVNVSETSDKIIVEAEVPGIDPKEIDISIQGENLVIKGEKKEEKEEKGKNFHRVESSYGSVFRSIALPASVDMDKITAESKHGVLKITLQKKEKAKPRQIKVEVK
ncbi:MAG: Hsp20/alpha crystallin family protein [Candidatus Brocadiaceae bacterium]|nr:Hsp20/alpha crystallin family protein [Candidatus Brocadiaceae bacterium]